MYVSVVYLLGTFPIHQAAKLFSEVLGLDSSIIDANYNLGVIALTCGRPLLAVSYLKNVMSKCTYA